MRHRPADLALYRRSLPTTSWFVQPSPSFLNSRSGQQRSSLRTTIKGAEMGERLQNSAPAMAPLGWHATPKRHTLLSHRDN